VAMRHSAYLHIYCASRRGAHVVRQRHMEAHGTKCPTMGSTGVYRGLHWGLQGSTGVYNGVYSPQLRTASTPLAPFTTCHRQHLAEKLPRAGGGGGRDEGGRERQGRDRESGTRERRERERDLGCVVGAEEVVAAHAAAQAVVSGLDRVHVIDLPKERKGEVSAS
jgi:hypothetical protein